MEQSRRTYNRAYNRIRISVSDAQETIDWYSKVLGFKLLGKRGHIKRSERPNDGIFQIYPGSLQEVKLAKMITSNGVRFEVFEFINPKFEDTEVFRYQQRGVFHICITDPDPEALAAKFEAEGASESGGQLSHLRRAKLRALTWRILGETS